MNHMLKLGKPLRRMALLLIVFWPLPVLAGTVAPASKSPAPPPASPYPIKTDQGSIKVAYQHPVQWEGRAVAIEGVVKSIKFDSRNRPNFEFALGRGGKTTIWATWPLARSESMSSFLRPGARLRVLGWVRDSGAWSKLTHLQLPRQNPMTLLPICLVNVQTSDALFVSNYAQYCKGWKKGEMPPDMAP